MPDYSVIRNDTVVNVIVAESLETAIAVSGDAEVIERIDGVPGKSWTRNTSGWITNAPAPFPSWVWNYEVHAYEAPEAMPDDGEPYVWNEDALTWEMFIPQEEKVDE